MTQTPFGAEEHSVHASLCQDSSQSLSDHGTRTGETLRTELSEVYLQGGNSLGHYVSPTFERAVTLHVVKNFMSELLSPPPLMLGIQGPPGEGKTFQCELVLQKLGVASFLISGGQLENHQAGKPAELIRGTYVRAGRQLQTRDATPVAVVLNDVDTGIGDWGDLVQYTVNRQTVIGELMHLADYPARIGGERVQRVPIILTGNDFTKLYSPLTRYGRMQVFTWAPTIVEKVPIVSRMLSFLEEVEVLHLLKELNEHSHAIGVRGDLPISFYAGLLGNIQDDFLWQTVELEGHSRFLRRVIEGSEPIIKSEISLSELIEQGKKMVSDNLVVDHLNSVT